MSVLQTSDQDKHGGAPVFTPVDLPRARSWQGEVARIWAHQWGRISRDEHDAACRLVFDHFDGARLHERVLEARAAQAYEGLTGCKPNIGILKCDERNVAVLAIGVAFLGGKAFLTKRAITLREPDGR